MTTKLIDEKSSATGIIIIYGVDKFISNLEEEKTFTKLLSNIKKYEKISVIIIEEAIKLKEQAYESWFKTLFTNHDGLWIGKGVTEQNVLKSSTYNREMTKEIKNNLGYVIKEGSANLVKIIDFYEENGSDDKDEQ